MQPKRATKKNNLNETYLKEFDTSNTRLFLVKKK